MSTVPPLDDEPLNSVPESNRVNDIEIRLLDAGARAKENLNREADQRYFLRWLAVVAVVLVMVGMGSLLNHIAHRIPAHLGVNVPGAFLVAAYVAPIVSMTTLAVSLLVAAFRGFKEGDERAGLAAVSEGVKASGFGS